MSFHLPSSFLFPHPSNIPQTILIPLHPRLNIILINLFASHHNPLKPLLQRHLPIIHILLILQNLNIRHLLTILLPLIPIDHHVRHERLLVEFQVDFPGLWEKRDFELAFKALTIGVLVVADDALDHFLALDRKLLGAEQFDPDPLAQGVEVLVQKQFLHLLVD